MKNPDSHIYLYAKGWYEGTDVVEDLRKIFGKRNAIEPEYIRETDLVQMLLNIVYRHIVGSGNPSLMFKEFVMDLHEDSYWKLSHDDDYSFNRAVIKKCLSVLRLVKIYNTILAKELVLLDSPDPSILPLSNLSPWLYREIGNVSPLDPKLFSLGSTEEESDDN